MTRSDCAVTGSGSAGQGSSLYILLLRLVLQLHKAMTCQGRTVVLLPLFMRVGSRGAYEANTFEVVQHVVF